MRVEIREATRVDSVDLARLADELGYPAQGDEVERRMAGLVPGRDAVFVAESEEAGVVGWVHVFVALRVESDPFAELGGLVVDSRFRDLGVGGRLVEIAEDWARGRGCGLLRVRTRLERAEAHRFYAARGFGEAKRQAVFEKVLE